MHLESLEVSKSSVISSLYFKVRPLQTVYHRNNICNFDSSILKMILIKYVSVNWDTIISIIGLLDIVHNLNKELYHLNVRPRIAPVFTCNDLEEDSDKFAKHQSLQVNPHSTAFLVDSLVSSEIPRLHHLSATLSCYRQYQCLYICIY